jgi:acyl dehydratase
MYFEEFAIGQEFLIDHTIIDKEKMIRFVQKYDPSPIHMDEVYAEKSKYGELIAQGIMSFMSVWQSLLNKISLVSNF